jgi:hypothetical protein
MRFASREDREGTMPLFMDIHEKVPEGTTADDVAQAHAADVATQEKYGVNYMKYWFNNEEGKIFRLVEAPDVEAANTVHREAHGLVADRVVEVNEGS